MQNCIISRFAWEQRRKCAEEDYARFHESKRFFPAAPASQRANPLARRNTGRVNAFREFDAPVPEGHGENSPAFQRWVVRFKATESRRDERELGFGVGILPSLRDLVDFSPQPSVETLGYCRMSLRDRCLPEFPKGIRVRGGSSLSSRSGNRQEPPEGGSC